MSGTLFGRTTTDVLAARLKNSALERSIRILVADWLIDTIEQVNPRFDRVQFLKLAGLHDSPPDRPQHT